MASNSILKLQVDDKQYEASLKSAQQGLQALMNALRNSGKSFSDLDKNTEQYVRALGNMGATAKNTRGRIGEMSSAFVELSQVEKQLTDQERQSPVGKALTESLDQLKQRTIEAKKELADLDKQLTSQKAPATTGGLFSGIGSKMEGALAVFGGNLMTKAAGAIANLGTEMADMVKQGVEMAKAGEGIRIAFERLGRGDLLDGLREATHGTVTDLELMKAAVKFNDFKLPVEELGTMLAFAQQKAKDTGQSVDYMVDSIVTGLGRKSLMILDNLGLSANEIKEKMKETGDMTKAVGEIIREQMAKAGDYVETAADRAAQANVSLQNKMEELGRKFAPLEEASNQLWTSMKISILDIVGGPLARLLNGLTEAGRLKNALNDINGDGGETRSSRRLRILREYSGSQTGVTKQTVYNRQIERYAAEEEKEWRKVNELTRKRKDILKELGNIDSRKDEKGVQANFLNAQANSLLSQINDAKNRAKAIQLSRQEYEKGAKQILQPIKQDVSSPTLTSPSGGGGKGGKAEIEAAIGSIDYQTKKVQELQKAWRAAADDDSRLKIKKEIEEQQYILDRMTGKEKFDPAKLQEIKPVELSFVPKLEMPKMPDIAPLKKQIEDELKNAATQVDTATLKTVLQDSIQNGINGMDLQFASLGDQIAKGIDVPDETWQTIIDQYNELRKQIDLEPIQINFKTGGIKEVNDGAKGTAKSMKAAAQAINSVGSALNSIEDPTARIVALVAQGIAAVVSAAGMATEKAAGQSRHWSEYVVAAASITAQMITIISQMHSASGYARGGIIKGNSYSGDNIGGIVDGSQFVGLNAGEVVLTASQTSNIASQLQNNERGVGYMPSHISGEQIWIALNRYTKRTGQGEIVTWR